MLRAVYIGLGCARHVRGRSRCPTRRLRRAIFSCRRSIRRLRRASFWCLLVFTRNVLPSQRFWCRYCETLLCRTDISSFLFTRRAANALVLGLFHRETVEQPDAAPTDEIPLTAARRGVGGVPRLVPVAHAIGVADLRGAGAVARPVVARMVRLVGKGASIRPRAGQDVVARRHRVANPVDECALFGEREFLRQVAAASRLVQRVSVYFGLDDP